jgi:hypothetical protein
VVHVVAVLSLAAVCVLWYGVQRWTGNPDTPLCGNADRDCGSCEQNQEP